MPILHAIILGAVQGLAEFLPISSSGHLILVPWLFGWEELTENRELNQTFDVALHMGTLAGALIYFAKDLVHLLRHDRRKGWLLVLSTIPAGLVGAVLGDAVANTPVAVIAVMLIVFGGVLRWADRLPSSRGEDSFGPRDAVLMGIAQAMALVPGVSRSGATISAGRKLGLTREGAARISFLMSLPVIAGAGLYKGVDLLETGIPAGFGPAFAWGMVTSAVTGFLAVWGLLRLVRTQSFVPFVIYRVAVGVAVLGLVVTDLR